MSLCLDTEWSHLWLQAAGTVHGQPSSLYTMETRGTIIRCPSPQEGKDYSSKRKDSDRIAIPGFTKDPFSQRKSLPFAQS